MFKLEDAVEIKSPPETIFKWLIHLDENYTDWHPDHLKARWIKGSPGEVGSVLYVEEYLGTQMEKLKFKLTKVITDRLIKYKLFFPESMICSGGSFEIKPKNGGSIFVATLSFRMGSILPKIFPSRLKALKKHMVEEGANLKMILEKVS